MNSRESDNLHNQADTLNRYLLNFHQSTAYADVESFTGEEALSQPYRYLIRFTSSDREINPDDV